MCALLEEQTARIEGAFGNDHDSPTLLGCLVDDGLDLERLDIGRTLTHAIAGQEILLAQIIDIHFHRVTEPLTHGLTIGPQLLFRHLFLAHGSHTYQCHQKHHT